jgi:hypothetical protein
MSESPGDGLSCIRLSISSEYRTSARSRTLTNVTSRLAMYPDVAVRMFAVVPVEQLSIESLG